MSFITVAGENKIAAMIAAHTPLNITQFVFANVPSLGIEPLDRIEALPAAGYIVDTKTVANQGYVSPNKVVYSIILDSSVGDYQFNWVGLKDADGVLIACEHLPLTTKTKTAGLIQGNNLARNFLIEFSGAQSVTGISTPASTWQFNFNNRLLQIDERERLSNFDTYGAAMFFGTGFLVTHSGLVCSMAAGLAFVGGVRCAKTAASALTVGGFPTDIYIDASLQGDISGVDAVIAFTASTTALVNYTDSLGFAHYVFKIASISAGGVVTDLRPLFNQYATKVGVQGKIYSTANSGGTADALTAAFNPPITALSHGMTFFVRAIFPNLTTAPTFTPNVGIISPLPIVKGINSSLAVGDIFGTGIWIELKYDAVINKFVLMNSATGFKQLVLNAWRATNLIVKNNVATPNTKTDISAEESHLYRPADGALILMTNVAVTVDIAVSGLNGLDTGTKSNNTWYALYLVSDGINLGAVLSLSFSAPTMPAGYTFKSFVGARRVNGSGNIVNALQLDKVVYTQNQNALVNGQAEVDGVPQLLDISVFIPPPAKHVIGLLSSSIAGNGVMRVFADSIGNGACGGNITAANNSEYYKTGVSIQQRIYWAQVSRAVGAVCVLNVTGYEL